MSVSRIRLAFAAPTVVGLVTLSACTGASGPIQPVPTGSASSSAGPATSPAAPQTTVSAPSPSTQPTAVGQSTKPAVPLTQPAKQSGLVIKLVELKAITSKGRGPGEVSGPALRVDVRVTNETSKDVAVTSLLVTLMDSASNPGGEMLGPPAKPMRGELKPGASVTGVWVFNVPVNRRKPVKIMVTLPTNAPVVLFRGNAPS